MRQVFRQLQQRSMPSLPDSHSALLFLLLLLRVQRKDMLELYPCPIQAAVTFKPKMPPRLRWLREDTQPECASFCLLPRLLHLAFSGSQKDALSGLRGLSSLPL